MTSVNPASLSTLCANRSEGVGRAIFLERSLMSSSLHMGGFLLDLDFPAIPSSARSAAARGLFLARTFDRDRTPRVNGFGLSSLFRKRLQTPLVELLTSPAILR